jgi:hypothetical protein
MTALGSKPEAGDTKDELPLSADSGHSVASGLTGQIDPKRTAESVKF